MDAARATEVATDYLARWSLPCRSAFLKFFDNEIPPTPAVVRTIGYKLQRLLKRLSPSGAVGPGYIVEVDTGQGIAHVSMSRDFVVDRANFVPSDARGWLLPLWAAYPDYDSMTIFWRMGSGEDYNIEWRRRYWAMTDAERSEYQRRFPPPTDPERGWGEDWYEHIARMADAARLARPSAAAAARPAE